MVQRFTVVRFTVGFSPKIRRARAKRSGVAWLVKPGNPVTVNRANRLLDFHFGTGFFELILHFGGLILGNAVLDGLGRAFDQVLGFLQAQPGDRPDFLCLLYTSDAADE